MPNLRSSLAAALSAAGLAAGIATQQPPSAAPRTLALLVGIAEYAAPPGGEAPAALQGPANDVARAKAMLVERFGFDAAGIATLVGPEATHEAIVRTFHRHLIRQAGPQTRVVFWFSGHGSRVPDALRRDGSPREEGQDPFDTTLMAYDSRAVDPAGSYDLTDDQLHSLLAALPSRDVVVVTDCCHSGGVLRGRRGPGVRQGDDGTAPLDRRRIEPFWPKDVPLLDDDVDAELRHVVQVAACGAREEAGELQTALGTFGTLTWFLTQTLREVEPQTSWGAVAATVRARVAGRGTRPAQTVLVVGAADRAVLGGIGRPVPKGFQVDAFGAKELRVEAGTVHGLGVGAELRLIDLDGREVGLAVVDRIAASSSVAVWQGADALPKAALRAVPKTFGDQSAPLRVALADGADPSLLDGCDYVHRVGDAATADYVLERAGDGLVLRERGGESVRALPAERAGVQLGLLKEHYFRSLWQGVAEPGRPTLRLSLEDATDADVQRFGAPKARMRASTDPTTGFPTAVVGAAVLDGRERSSGGLLRLRVDNVGQEDLHVAIVSVAENREVNVVHGRDESNVVRAGDHVSKCVWVGLHPDWPDDRPLVDRYVVVATSRFADFRAFESEAPRRDSGTRGANFMPPFLREAVGGARTRGPELEQPSWGIVFCDLQLVSPLAERLLAAREQMARRRWPQALDLLVGAVAVARGDADRGRLADQFAEVGAGLLQSGADEAAQRALEQARQLRPDSPAPAPADKGGEQALAPAPGAADVAVVALALDPADAGDAGFLAVAEKARAFHRARSLAWDGRDPDELLRRLGAGGAPPATILFVLRPERFDVMLHRRILLALVGLDDDPLVDAAFGYLTARDAAALERLWQRTEAVHRGGLCSRTWHSVGVATGMRSRTYSGHRSELEAAAGFRGDSIYFGVVEADPDVRAAVARELPRLESAGVLTFGGNGDPQGIWLFAGERNLDRTRHWDYSPERVGQDPDGVMPRLLAEHVRALRLASPVVWSGTCHAAATHRVFLEGDIVSTFGRAPAGTVHELPTEQSLGLAFLDAGAVALLAPAGPNHGIAVLRETAFALQHGASLGEAVKSTWDDVLLAARGPLRLDLVVDGRRLPAGEQVMQGGGANRVLLGDPLLRPFAPAADPRQTVRVERGDGGKFVVHVSWAEGFQPRGWDMYGTDRANGSAVPVRIVVDGLLPGTATAVDVEVEACAGDLPVPVVLGHAVLERYAGRRYLHLQANGARAVIEGKALRVRFDVTPRGE